MHALQKLFARLIPSLPSPATVGTGILRSTGRERIDARPHLRDFITQESGDFNMVGVIGKSLRVAGIGVAALFLQGSSKPTMTIGAPAPPFVLTLADGSHVSLDQMRGDVVVLNLWATWCVPCRAELPMLDHYYDVRGKYGLRMFALVTEDDVPEYKMRKLFKVLKLQAATRVKGPYASMGGVPTNYVFDRSGHLRYAKAAAFDIESLNAVLAPLLAEPRPADAPPREPLPPPPHS